MFDLIDPEIENYCEEHTFPESALLYALNRETHLKVLRPRMLSGQLQGAFLTMISKMIKPLHILEIGTYTGYSTLCLAEGLLPNGTIDTIEIDEELENMIQKFFHQSQHHHQINLMIGDACTLIPQLNKSYDLVFIDAEKKDYLCYFELILPLVKTGGFILTDNVLWSGKVVQDVPDNDKDTHAILAFNDFVQNDQRVTNVMLPFRDGMTIMMKN